MSFARSFKLVSSKKKSRHNYVATMQTLCKFKKKFTKNFCLLSFDNVHRERIVYVLVAEKNSALETGSFYAHLIHP